MLALGAATALAAAPPSGLSVTPGGASGALERVLTWSAVSGDLPVTYEAAVTVGSAPPLAGSNVGAATSTSLAVPEGQVWFHVRSVEGGVLPSGWSSVGPVISDRTPPTITPVMAPAANPRGWTNAPVVTVNFACGDTVLLVSCSPPVAVGEGGGQVVSGTATDSLITSTATTTVNVDRTAPVSGALLTPASGATVTSARPEFTWSESSDPAAVGLPEAGGSGIQYHEVWIIGRGKVGATTAAVRRLVPAQSLDTRAYQWYLRTVDNAGNAVVSAPVTFTVNPNRTEQPPDPPGAGGGGSGVSGTGSGSSAPTGSAAGTPVVRRVAGETLPRPTVIRARALRPVAGKRIDSRQPTLRWLRRHRQAKLYNVQIFELSATGVRKVVSAFPRGASYKVPRGKLKANRRYVWRVWPYLGRKGYASQPTGISYFDVAK